MASYSQGYDEERFATTVSQNFLCLICFNVLKDPVECPRNQHCFCRGCITRHLKNSQRCPTCSDVLTVETLIEPHRMVKDYLNDLNIHCKYFNRGCLEIVQLQHLDRHEVTCGFTPVVCTNQGCGATVNKRDQIHHESELCEFRKLKCHSCGEMTKTLVDIEKRLANVEKNVATMENKMANIEKNVEIKVETTATKMLTTLKADIAEMKTDMDGKHEAMKKEVTGLKTALIESFNEIKDVLVKSEDPRKFRGGASGDMEKENIIVAGGMGTNSVEMFNWRQKVWSPLQSLPKERFGATSFFYDNNMTVVAGSCSGSIVDDMIKMNIALNTILSSHWNECPIKLPAPLAYHGSVVYKDQLIITGGYNKILKGTSDCIDEVQLIPPFSVKTLSTMPEPRRGHCTEIIEDNLLIVGGRTTNSSQDNLSSVLLYDIKKNECKQLAPLPYEVGHMATVKWGDSIVVIGGIDKLNKTSSKVIMYNVETEQHHMLPSMRCCRAGCTAVVIGNNIVVLGGWGKDGHLKSVEAFDFHRNTWEDLPEMSDGRWLATAVAV